MWSIAVSSFFFNVANRWWECDVVVVVVRGDQNLKSLDWHFLTPNVSLGDKPVFRWRWSRMIPVSPSQWKKERVRISRLEAYADFALDLQVSSSSQNEMSMFCWFSNLSNMRSLHRYGWFSWSKGVIHSCCRASDCQLEEKLSTRACRHRETMHASEWRNDSLPRVCCWFLLSVLQDAAVLTGVLQQEDRGRACSRSNIEPEWHSGKTVVFVVASHRHPCGSRITCLYLLWGWCIVKETVNCSFWCASKMWQKDF